jgi:hypothetical protein
MGTVPILFYFYLMLQVQAADTTTWQAFVSPNTETDRAMIFTVAGVTDIKTCVQDPKCKLVTEVKQGEVLTVLDGIQVNGRKYYRINQGTKTGYVEESHIMFFGTEPICSSGPTGKFISDMNGVNQRAVRQAANTPKELFDVLDDPQTYSPLCKNFMDSDGNFGPWGRQMIQIINRQAPDCIYNQLDMSELCPNYKNFPKEKKDQLMMWMFLNLSMDEASCNPKAVGEGTNDIADGLFQMERTYQARAGAERDPRYCATDHGVDSFDLKFQFECTISTLDQRYCKKGRKINSKDGYWQELNQKTRWVARQVMKFPGCF